MATATLTHHKLAGTLGEILVDVRAGSRGVSQPAVILAHGFKGFKDFAFFPTLADRLVKDGYSVVGVTVSGAGVDASGEFSRLDLFAVNSYSRELDDLRTVADALMAGELGVEVPSSLGLLGHSRGGGMALLLASEYPAVAAVATWCAIGKARRHSDSELAAWKEAGEIRIFHGRLRIHLPLSFEVAADCLANETGRLNIPGASASLRRPWLQVHGTADETVPYSEAQELAATAGAQHELFKVEGAGHTFGTSHPWQGSTTHFEAALARTTEFFSEYLS